MINKRINLLQETMKLNGLDYYIINSSDYHNNEYLEDYFKVRQYFSGFTGSTGTLLVGLDNVYLFVDGRYHLQAEYECKNTNIIIVKVGLEDQPNIIQFLSTIKKVNIGVDTRCFTTDSIFMLMMNFTTNTNNIIDIDLVSDIITNRTSMNTTNAYTINNSYTYQEKINDIYDYMDEYEIDTYILNDSECINYILNIRGDDVEYNLVSNCYMIIYKDSINLYIDNNKISNIKEYLDSNNINICNYNEFYNDISNINNRVIGISSSNTNYKIFSILERKNEIYELECIVSNMKSIKTDEEVDNMKLAHIYDAVAMIKFIYNLYNDKYSDELDVANSLDKIRLSNSNCIKLSFNTISGYESNGAIVHYSVNKDTNKKLDKESLLLVDSGAHYNIGTTDITRTFYIGDNVSDKIKLHYTSVLKGLINVSIAKGKSITSNKLDKLARKAIKDIKLNYLHGSGHGVGYMQSVHESVVGISSNSNMEFIDNMITSIEPGIYIENEYGIRLENLIVYRNNSFETLTLVPFDKKCINYEMLNKEELNYLNTYNETIINTLKEYLNSQEYEFLLSYI